MNGSDAQDDIAKKKRTEAFKLAKEVRDELPDRSISVRSLLRKCHRISKLLDKEKQNEWITLELNGYSVKYPKVKDLEGHLPDYRWAPCRPAGCTSKTIQTQEVIRVLSEEPTSRVFRFSSPISMPDK